MSRDNVVALGVLLCYAVMIAAARWAVLRGDRRRLRPKLELVRAAPATLAAPARRARPAERRQS
jgi:hypothetical protein